MRPRRRRRRTYQTAGVGIPAGHQATSAPLRTVLAAGRACFRYPWSTAAKREKNRAHVGGAPFCVVAAFGSQCFYYDARAAGGHCCANCQVSRRSFLRGGGPTKPLAKPQKTIKG